MAASAAIATEEAIPDPVAVPAVAQVVLEAVAAVRADQGAPAALLIVKPNGNDLPRSPTSRLAAFELFHGSQQPGRPGTAANGQTD